jgi:hypothetical protein
MTLAETKPHLRARHDQEIVLPDDIVYFIVYLIKVPRWSDTSEFRFCTATRHCPILNRILI